MSASIYGRGLNGVLKKFWNEKPGVTAATVVGIIGLTLCSYDIYLMKTGPRLSKYKNCYMVVRPDDPLVNEPERTFPF